MPNGRKLYFIIAAIVIIVVILPLFGFLFSVFGSLGAAFCHASR